MSRLTIDSNAITVPVISTLFSKPFWCFFFFKFAYLC